MHCTLLIPDLLPPSDLGAGPFADLRVPNIGTLLARGETARRPPLASEDWLCEQFGVATQPDRPLAALMLRADGGAPQHYYWLCAEPVRLRVDRKGENGQEMGAIVDTTLKRGGSLIVTADHGNAEQMWDPATNAPHTAHTTYDVPLIVVGARKVTVAPGAPSAMAGASLRASF